MADLIQAWWTYNITGRNFVLFFLVILRYASLLLRIVLSYTLKNLQWTRDSGNPIWKLITILTRFRFLCYMFEIIFSLFSRCNWYWLLAWFWSIF